MSILLLSAHGSLPERSTCDDYVYDFYEKTAGTAIARLSHRNSVGLSVRLSVTRVNQSKTVQARITKSSLSAAWKTLVFWIRKAFP